MTKPKVYVTDYEFPNLKFEEEVLLPIGAELIGVQCKTEEDIIEKCKDAVGLINQYAPISRKVMESLPNLKVVARYGVGVNTIDLPAATDLGICAANVPDYCMDEVSDHAMALILACARKVVLMNNEVKKGNWDYKVSIPIYRIRGKNLGLISFGRIAQTLAGKARAIGMNLLVFDPYVPETVAKQYDAKLVSLEELLRESDFISVHAPLTAETEHLISEKELQMMKKSAFIVNTGRGPVIDEKALIKALQEGWIAGAGLDVIEVEPPTADNPLLKMDNVVINPHAAWYSIEAEAELRTKTARGVAEVLQGYFPKYLVNRDVKAKLQLKEL
ncbi:C-terminal binding protein [Desulforamulus putei]|uniref:D-3-phosphoglycerate dehydrogenase n=1 Tax=Desulforamulus putei DSM 12395 TaxID=1121429 RepID=A0A1M5BYK1_9FIRM|nr:C-terminal binding protein [Desulforamulus putei]SHF47598.1 D-3-phosphoglycerate dehydrogenase [Desulforamulus putei DSM 12395]